jgi:hypothetical protein
MNAIEETRQRSKAKDYFVCGLWVRDIPDGLFKMSFVFHKYERVS